MNGNTRKDGESDNAHRLPFLNFRPLLFCAVGLCLGIFICLRLRFGGLGLSDFLFCGALLFVALFPFSLRRAACLALCVLLFAGLGFLVAHVYTANYFSGREEGRYEVVGSVTEFTVYRGYTSVVLDDLTVDGEPTAGKLAVTVNSDAVRAGDRLRFTANVRRSDAPAGSRTFDFVEDVRYRASSVDAETLGTSPNVFLRVNSALYDTLHGNMHTEEADLIYALLMGNSRGMDEGLLTSVRKGGIAHIFAVSGLHIGILYGAAVLLFKFCGRWASLPALAVATLYTAVCGFPVSAVRALLMCGAHAVCKLLRRKADLLNILSLAAVIILLISPAEWLSAGFQLSFGACLGLALFADAFNRAFRRLHLPRPVASCLSASLAVQICTFPVLLDCFGYVSLSGILVNLVLIPILPAIYLGALLPSVLALAIPPAAFVFCAVPEGLASALLFVLAEADVALIATGISLGAGAAVWMAGCVALSGRFRMTRPLRIGACGLFCILLSAVLFLRNAVVTGCKVTVSETPDCVLALVRTPTTSALILDGAASLDDCEEFLARNLPHAPDAVLVLSPDEMRAVNSAAFLGADTVYVLTPAPTGLNAQTVVCAEEVTLGGLKFRYESAHKLVLFAEGTVVEFDLGAKAVRSADFSVEKGDGDLNFFLRHGIIKAL